MAVMPTRASLHASSAPRGERSHCRIVGEEPHRSAKQIRISQHRASALLARHRMTRQKCRAPRCVEQTAGRGRDLTLGAPHIGHQVCRRQHGRKLLHVVECRVDGHAEDHDFALACQLDWIGRQPVQRAHLERLAPAFPAAVPAAERARESGGAQRQSQRGAKQASAQDGDTLDHVSTNS